MGTAHIWDWKNERKSNIAHSFPPSNTGSAAVQAGCPRFPTTPLTGSGTQILCALQGGAPLPNCEEYFRFPKDSLPRAAKKSQPITCTLCQREHVYACLGGRFPELLKVVRRHRNTSHPHNRWLVFLFIKGTLLICLPKRCSVKFVLTQPELAYQAIHQQRLV